MSLLTLAACGGGLGKERGVASGGDGLSGYVDISGSSTVAPITARAAELFEDEEPGVLVNVDGPGTGDGFLLFCDGDTDIADASRPIKDLEIERCEANGIDFIELQIAIDGLSVLTSGGNDAVSCLSFADLYALVGPESQGFDRWSDAQRIATELGSDTHFPDARLDILGPGEESGTYDSFVEIVIEDFAEERGHEAQTRPDYQSSADDNVILQGVTGSSSPIGWVGYAFAHEAGDSVRQLAIQAEVSGECVEPTPDTIASGDYPIARPLFVYVHAERAESNPALAAYVDHLVSQGGRRAVTEVGYVQLDDATYERTRSTWSSRATGTNPRSFR